MIGKIYHWIHKFIGNMAEKKQFVCLIVRPLVHDPPSQTFFIDQ